MQKTLFAGLALGLFLTGNLSAKYKIKPVEVRPATEYPDHQNFQNVIIGAQAFVTKEEVLEIFDAKKLYEQEIVPVLLVIENNNDFAIRIEWDSIFLTDENGANYPPLHPTDVLLSISLKKPLSSYSTRKDILLRRAVSVEMLRDFQHKAFGEKLIAPRSSDYGVVFFYLPDSGDLSSTRLYLPEVENLTSGESLMFFEFNLSVTR